MGSAVSHPRIGMDWLLTMSASDHVHATLEGKRDMHFQDKKYNLVRPKEFESGS